MRVFYMLTLLVLPFLGHAQVDSFYKRTTWTATASSEELVFEGPVSGRAPALIDGDDATYWSSGVGSNSPYPHTLIFDMQEAHPVNYITYRPRIGEQYNIPALGSVSFSDDGITFGTEIPVSFPRAQAQNIIFLRGFQNHRYFKVTVNQNVEDHDYPPNHTPYTQIAEIGAGLNYHLAYTLGYFKVSASAVNNALSWNTSAEVNSTDFLVQRSADAVNFTTIGTVTAAGNSLVQNNYSFTDPTPVSDINFYRLILNKTSVPADTSNIINAEFPWVNYSSSQPKTLNVFYFVPAGKAVWPDFKARQDTIVLQLQNYYKNEMIRNGRGSKTFGLLTDPTHTKVKIIVVNGKNPFFNYTVYPGGGGNGAIRAEIDAYMFEHPSTFYSSHTLIICPADSYDPATGIVTEGIPVIGAGKYCYALDYPAMKWSLLGGSGVESYAATINIGGTAHEGGHGLNLSHNHLKVSEQAANLGTSLMSFGNGTFGAAGQVTSLTTGDCAILNRNEVFNDGSISYYGPAGANISTMYACYNPSKNAIIAAGRTNTTGSPVTDVVIYNDPNNGTAPGMGANKDYDAVTWTVPIIGTDSFYVEMPISDLQVHDSSLYEMKVRLIQQDGNLTDAFYHYYFAANIPHLNDPAFTPISANITASTGANGSISSPGITAVDCAGDKTYTFTPNAGFMIADVIVDGVSQGALSTYTFNSVAASHTISVTFTTVVLPITLVNFTASLQGKNNALLKWETSQEINNSGYEIQMLSAQNIYEKTGFVPGHGSTAVSNSYNHVVKNLAPGTYYFRLKIIDLDGSFTYSQIRSIKVTGTLDITINFYPNPVKGAYVFLEILNAQGKDATITITNALGQVIKSYSCRNFGTPIKIQMPSAAGDYFIRVSTGDGKDVFKKIIKL